MVESSKLLDYCDVFLANACRCRPPQGGDITQKHIRTCRPFLQIDVEDLQKHYREVILVGLGAKACYSIAKLTSLNTALKQQGSMATMFTMQGGPNNYPRMFFTYHPAMLHPMRQPAKVRAVEAHFVLLRRYLEGNFIPNDIEINPELGLPIPIYLPTRVACDIETYGILRGKEQTVFNPIKSKYIDGIDFDKQVVTVNFTWRSLSNELRTAEYVFSDPKHRRIIQDWFRTLSKRHHIVVGQNVKFDLEYLATSDKVLRYWIDPRRLRVDDTMILAFLLYEQQPEKGLKELATLYGISDYSDMKVSGKSGNAKSPWDKELHRYNCMDGATTHVLYFELLRRIAEKYGDKSEKLSNVCADVRNMIIWDTFDLEMNGSSLDISKLKVFHDKELARCKELLEITEVGHELKLAGKGSDKPLREFMLECLGEADLLGDPRVEWTPKMGGVSIGVENVNLLKKNLPEGEHLTIISYFQEYKERSKIVSTYTRPLLEKPRQGIVTRSGNIGMVYPSWYPIPSYFERGKNEADIKGQMQGRFSCSKPARLTEPRSIRDCSISRWKGGTLAEYDVSQDHLRMAAILSGDPLLMDAYLNPTESIHTRTAVSLFPDADPIDPNWKKTDKYQVGKDLNFLVLFKGGPGGFQSLVLKESGIEIPIDFCDFAIKTWYRDHPVYKEWQDSMIDLAAKQGYLVLPTGWSRTFALGPQGIANYTNEVCNFLHQGPCAQITQSAQYQILCNLRRYHLKTVVPLQIYDSVFTDQYPGEEKDVDEIVGEAMTHPPLLKVFEDWTGRSVPWIWEKKTYDTIS